jgi:hypothetical protein
MRNQTTSALRLVKPTKAPIKPNGKPKYSRYSYATIRKELRSDAAYLRYAARANLIATAIGIVLLCVIGRGVKDAVDALGSTPAGDNAFWTSCLLCGFMLMFCLWNIGMALSLSGTSKEIRRKAERLSWKEDR